MMEKAERERGRERVDEEKEEVVVVAVLVVGGWRKRSGKTEG